MAASPWASGPGEILQHGLTLLKKESDTNRRLAMISIDNAVELMIKTFLGLPRRITGIQIGRDKYREISESFPRLLDALEEYAVDKLDGIDLGEVEWYHRLRNELYHQGNGLTVERDKVEVYAELARLLFKNLFGFDLPIREDQATEQLGAFMQSWLELELLSQQLVNKKMQVAELGRRQSITNHLRALAHFGILTPAVVDEIEHLRRIRNEVIHGIVDHKTAVTPTVVQRVRRVTSELEKKLREEVNE